ncbi:MAG: 4-hydroxy-tetrahydrodipicolinate synthase [Coriobacteriia bacterium]|nr:4-hydroxy-tetrahydrodipicolinate synthase [Coriobacteriia bacterium]MCL2537162.1 4-hydroxy-tetrahydrodipicolinate synthase [Coriobacteriia bacterium]
MTRQKGDIHMAYIPRFGRLLTAMVTPFKEDGSLDLPRAQELALKLIEQGNDGLIVNGTTGESPTISRDERCDLFEAVIEAVGDDVPLVANIGDNCTEDSVLFAQRVCALKGGRINAIMAVTPYYNKPPQEGIYQHMRLIAEAVEVPVVVYNIPGRSVVNIDPDTIIRLADDVPNIRALKQANDDMAQLETIVANTPDDFEIFAGDDCLTLPNLERGGVGVISTIGNIAAPAMKEMIEAYMAGNKAAAEAIDQTLRPLQKQLFTTSNPILVKRALALLDFPVGPVRLPLVNATEDQTAELLTVMSDTFRRLDEL